MILRDDVAFEVEDDGGMLFAVERTRAGSLSARVRVWGRVVIDGVEYEYDRDDLRVALRRALAGG